MVLKILERSAVKVARYVLRGLGGSNVTWLPDATILKSPKATETTLAIIETFTKVRDISRTIKAIPQTPQNSPKYQELMQKTGDLISDLVVPDDLDTSETEASIEVNLAIVKFKYSVKKKNK